LCYKVSGNARLAIPSGQELHTVTFYPTRAALAAPKNPHTVARHFGLAAQVTALAALGAPLGQPLLRDATFGLLLCALVGARFYRLAYAHGAHGASEPWEFCRHSSRVVYLALYAALLVQFSCSVFSFSWGGGDVALGWSSAFRAAPQELILQCGEAFRGHLLAGVMVLLLIRVLASRLHRVRASPAH
jgi:hypothetical protein